MFVELLISMFGIAFAYRILSLLEKTELISSSKLNFFFCFLQVPFYLLLFFKELRAFVLIYIGIFLITLILFDKIFDYFRQKEFEALQIHIIERLILLLKSGKSAQTSAKIVFNDLTNLQKQIFSELTEFSDIKTGHQRHLPSKQYSQQRYFDEIGMILLSTNNVIEQLKSFQRALKLENDLRHRSRQATQQIKMQAAVSFFIYVGFIILAKNYLKFEIWSLSMLLSLILFIFGQILIFKIGGRIKWQT